MSDTEPVWTFRGYQLRPSEFNTAMVHFFRAEISRANIWRQRLDTTTNWAVVSTGAAISFAFSEAQGNSAVILLNILLVTMFLWIEARRYRYYELWSSRVRLMETDFFAAMLVPPFRPSPDWAESLAEGLLQPHFSVSILEAVGRRLRRNYFWIYMIMALAWVGILGLQPEPASSVQDVVARAGIGPIPGPLVVLAVIGYYVFLTILALLTIGLHSASGEVLPRYTPLAFHVPVDGSRLSQWQAWFRPSGRRQQLIAFVITDQAKPVSDHILSEMGRGVTALAGKGMYTGKEHSVLMCALTVTEVNQLKSLVLVEDPNAFVIVSPAQGVFGRGFSPLQTEKPVKKPERKSN